MSEQDSLCTIIVGRHGQTEWNVSGTIQGHMDSPLTTQGEQQAHELATELKDLKFDAIFSSDLLRAKRTAEIVAIEHQLAVVTSEALRERKLGKLEGTKEDEYAILQKLRESAQKSGYEDLGIERDEQIAYRLITFLRKIVVAYPSKNVLVITHGGVLRVLLVHLGFSSNDEINSAIVSNTAYIKLKSDGVDFFIEKTKGIKVN